MAAQASYSESVGTRRKRGGSLVLPLGVFALFLLVAGVFVAYALWPTWPGKSADAHAPALPVTVAGALFEVPPAAIRTALQRHPGPHERVDLAFLWPSLQPAQPGSLEDDANDADKSAALPAKAAMADTAGRIFATITPLGSLLPPDERLRYVYPRYAEAQARPGPDGLAILPFRAGTPYEGQDLVYFADQPDRFFTLCTRDSGVMTGTCIYERLVGAADFSLRFPRDWLKDWNSVLSGLNQLMARLHPQQN